MIISFEKKLILFFLILITGVIYMGITTSKINKTTRLTDHLIQHSREVQFESEQVYSSTQQMASSSRGYIITDELIFFQSFEDAKREVNRSIENLGELIKNDPEQKLRVDTLKMKIYEVIEFSTLSMKLRKNVGFNQAQQLITFSKGKYFIGEVQSLVRKIQLEEDKLLKIQKEANLKSVTAFDSSFFILLIFKIVFLVSTYFVINKNIRARKDAEGALSRSNDELKQKVEDRTAELTKANEVLVKQEELLFDTATLAKVGGWEINLDDMSVFWTREVFSIHELELGNMKSVKDAILFYPPEVRSELQDAINKTITHGTGFDLELPFITAKGKNIWVRSIGKAEIRNGKITRVFGVIKDITVHKLAEQKINKANRLYYFISQVNTMIVNSLNEESLFKEVCNIAIEVGKFKMAWIGILDENTKRVIPMMHAGEMKGYLSEMKHIFLDDEIDSAGPIGTALREGKYCIYNNSENDPLLTAVGESAKSNGFLSSIALPIKKYGKVVGAFSLYSAEKNYFDNEEIALLVEATGDISYALENFDKESRRKSAEEKMVVSELSYRRLFEAAKDGILILNAGTGEIEDVNPFMVEMLGYSHDEFLGKQLFEIGLFRDIEANKESFIQLKKVGYIRYDNLPLKTKDGREIWVEFVSNSYYVNEKQVIQCNIRETTEKKLAEEKLKRSEAFSIGVLNSLSSHIAVVNSVGIIVSNNESWKQFALQNGETNLQRVGVGSNYFAVCEKSAKAGNADATKALNGMKAVTSGNGATFYMEYPCHSKNGQRWFGMRVMKFDNDESLLVVAHENISVRKLAEQKEKESEVKFRSIIEQADEIICITDSSNRFIECNPVASRMLGYTREELLQMKSSDIYFPEDLKANSVLFSGFINEKTKAHERRLKRKDGGSIEMEMSGKTMSDGRIMLFGRDISEQKLSKEKLLESEARLNEAQALSHISNWGVDLVTGVNTWSNEFYRIFGVNSEDTPPELKTFLEFLVPDDRDIAYNLVKTAFETYEASSFYFRFLKNGELRFGFTEWRFEFDKNNKPIRLFGILQDITDRKNTEIERSKMTEDIVQRNKDLEQFTYIVSHNLRAPVANILGISKVLTAIDLKEDEREEMLFGLSTSVIKPNGVIMDLNNILQIKRNLSEETEVASFSHLVKNIRISISDLIREEQVEIITDFKEVDKMLTLKSYLYSIFYNLISNSIKYKQPDLVPVIEIRSYMKKDSIELRFKDNGLGIDLTKKGDQVFGLYKRFHSHKEGKGMGLFMVKTQVESLGGKISIESEVNIGTTFILQFPK